MITQYIHTIKILIHNPSHNPYTFTIPHDHRVHTQSQSICFNNPHTIKTDIITQHHNPHDHSIFTHSQICIHINAQHTHTHNTHTHTHTHAYTHTDTHTHTHTHTYTHIQTHNNNPHDNIIHTYSHNSYNRVLIQSQPTRSTHDHNLNTHFITHLTPIKKRISQNTLRHRCQ